MGESLPDILYVLCRAVSFILLLTTAGIVVFLSRFRRLLAHSAPVIARLAQVLAGLALASIVATYALEAARMTGEFSDMLDAGTQQDVLFSRAGAVAFVRGAALLLILTGVRQQIAAVTPLSLLGAVLIVVVFTLTGHTAVTPHHWAAAGLLTLHLGVVSFWIGALWPLYVVAARERGSVAVSVIDAFSALAMWLVPAVLVAGIGLIVLLVPGLGVFRQPYGQLLLGKAALFALLMILATLNKWWFGPDCAAGRVAAFQRTVVVEYLLIGVVLFITAALTTFYSPETP